MATRGTAATILERYLEDFALPTFLLKDITRTFAQSDLLAMSLNGKIDFNKFPVGMLL